MLPKNRPPLLLLSILSLSLGTLFRVASIVEAGNLFPESVIWHQVVSREPVHEDSAKVIEWMARAGNSFDPDDEFRIDLSLRVLEAAGKTLFRDFETSEYFYPGECDRTPIPVPDVGAVEGNPTYRCDDGGDCHLIVIHPSSHRLFEMWKANLTAGTASGGRFEGGCLAVWDLTRTYGWIPGENAGTWGRGLECTSADAAGLPITPLLFTPEELARGRIDHALRFVLPNRNIRHKAYTAPATHATSAASGPPTAPPYGARFRLKPDDDLQKAHPDVNLQHLSRGARVIMRALQQYGMFLADGGAIALTGQSDVFSPIQYCGGNGRIPCDENPDRLLHEHDLIFLRITDFDMLPSHSPVHIWQGDCRLDFNMDADGRVSPAAP